MARRVKLALVGCGAISHTHLKAIHQHDDLIYVTALIDPEEKNALQIKEICEAHNKEKNSTHTIHVYKDLTQALEANKTATQSGGAIFEAVDLMIPHHIHRKISIEALQANLHVLLEKPMANSLEECADILAAAKKTDRVFMVGENAQYWPEIVRAKQLIQEGAIGELISARAVYTQGVKDERYGTTPQQNEWRNDKSLAGGGIAIDGGSHWIRPLRMWFGEIDEVVGITDRPLQAMQGESLVRAIFKFKSGKHATFDGCKAETFFAPDPWWRILGQKGEIVIDHHGIRVYSHEHKSGKLELDPPRGYFGSFAPEIEDFAKAILHGKKLEAEADFSLGELRTALAIYKSKSTHAWAKVWDE